MFDPMVIGVAGPLANDGGGPYTSQPQSTSRRGTVLTIVPKTLVTLDNPGIDSPSNGTVYTGYWYFCHPLNFSVQRLVLTSNKPQHSIPFTIQVVGQSVQNRAYSDLTDEIRIDDIRDNPQSIPVRGQVGNLGAVFVSLTMEYNPTIPLELYASLELLGSEVTN